MIPHRNTIHNITTLSTQTGRVLNFREAKKNFLKQFFRNSITWTPHYKYTAKFVQTSIIHTRHRCVKTFNIPVGSETPLIEITNYYTFLTRQMTARTDTSSIYRKGLVEIHF